MKDQQDFEIGHMFEEPPKQEENVETNLWGMIYDAVQQWPVIKKDYKDSRQAFIKYKLEHQLSNRYEEAKDHTLEQAALVAAHAKAEVKQSRILNMKE